MSPDRDVGCAKSSQALHGHGLAVGEFPHAFFTRRKKLLSLMNAFRYLAGGDYFRDPYRQDRMDYPLYVLNWHWAEA